MNIYNIYVYIQYAQMLVQSRLEEKLEAERLRQAALAEQQCSNEGSHTNKPNGAPAGVTKFLFQCCIRSLSVV